MQFAEGKLYHVYNRGNNQQPVFFKPENYIFFLEKVRRYIRPKCNLLAYCLMPNHFHFLLQATPDSVIIQQTRHIRQTELSDGFRQLLSTYTQAINKQENRTGSLFSQNTKAKLVSCDETKMDYSLLCLNYIHQNPVQAGLVTVAEDWQYSSFPDYAKRRNGTLCSRNIAYQLIDADWTNFIAFAYELLPENYVDYLY